MSTPPAALALDPRHSGDFLRLQRLLAREQGFQLILAGYTAPAYRDGLIAQLQAAHPQSLRHDPPATCPAGVLIDTLAELSHTHPIIHLGGLDHWLAQQGVDAWHILNRRRESLAQHAPARLVFWLPEGQLTPCAHEAPDLWAWRTAVLDFSTQPNEVLPIHQNRAFLGNTEKDALYQRLKEIQDYLAQRPEPTSADGGLMLECTEIHERLGAWSQALTQAHAALELFKRLNHPAGQAWSWGRIADILQRRGQLDEALRIRTEQELPVYEKLGDVRSVAVTQGKIADILQARGQLDEALRIRTELQWPVFEKLGDVGARATIQGRIADILQACGQLDEALRIFTDKIPVFEKLGDVRSVAVTQGKIADILQARGQLSEALRIRTQLQLPIFEQLGDIRSAAITKIKIGDIRRTQGRLSEALDLYTQQLQVFEQLGEAPTVEALKTRIATLRQQMGLDAD
ncbi:MAG: hypothetical protein ACRCTU_06575 [Zoogloea sp.]|uniref:tetratricopeptide repeat protein n=1 Tax=Zoogloea sp. TaxID=49181 RepID=UPI003F31B066